MFSSVPLLSEIVDAHAILWISTEQSASKPPGSGLSLELWYAGIMKRVHCAKATELPSGKLLNK